MQGVTKVFRRQSDSQGINFQNIYTELKTLSKILHGSTTDEVHEKLSAAEIELDKRVETLVDEDNSITPSLLRQFFGRVTSYDARILGQLLRFMIYTRDQSPIAGERLDKADFLMTRLGEELGEHGRAAIERAPRRLDEMLNGLWQALDVEAPDADRVDDTVKEIHTLREAFSQIEGLEQFNEFGIVRGYRSLKHGLGELMFFPEIANEIVGANLYLRAAIESFYRKEEQRIAAEYQEVFELERGAPSVDSALDSELQTFRGEVESFERNVKKDDVKLAEVIKIREKARELAPKLRQAGAAEILHSASEFEGRPDDQAMQAADEVVDWQRDLPSERPTETLRIRTANAELLAGPLRQVLKVLEASDWRADPRIVAQVPDAQSLRLETREVLAYRRLHAADRFDSELEQFLIEAAALRVLVSSQAEDIVASIDRLDDHREDGVFVRARQSCRLASAFDQRFAHFIRIALVDGRLNQAQNLQLLHMRLLRDYSGLWLLVFG